MRTHYPDDVAGAGATSCPPAADWIVPVGAPAEPPPPEAVRQASLAAEVAAAWYAYAALTAGHAPERHAYGLRRAAEARRQAERVLGPGRALRLVADHVAGRDDPAVAAEIRETRVAVERHLARRCAEITRLRGPGAVVWRDPRLTRPARVARQRPRPSRAARPRERRLAVRTRGARAPGRPSADGGDSDDDPPLRACAACGRAFAPRRADARYCAAPECRRARVRERVAAHRRRHTTVAAADWRCAEARAVALVRRGLASPADALAALIAGLAAAGVLATAGGAR